MASMVSLPMRRCGSAKALANWTLAKMHTEAVSVAIRTLSIRNAQANVSQALRRKLDVLLCV